MKFNELGRSMVEMLGVLAIIGVLSVGAISGYSKAMMKYKINKFTSQLSELLSTIYPLLYEHKITPSNSDVDFAQFLDKTNSLPDGLSYAGYYKVKNALGLEFSLSYNTRLAFAAYYEQNPTSIEACLVTFEMIKDMALNNNRLVNIAYMCGSGQTQCTYYVHSYNPIDGKILPQMTTSDLRNECVRYADQGNYYLVIGFSL